MTHPAHAPGEPRAQTPLRERVIGNVRALPSYGYGPASPVWWGTLAFITLEGTGFVLAAGAYLFLHFMNPDFPLSAPPPELLWSTALTVLMLASAWPNQLAKKNAENEDLRRARRDLVIMSVIGIVLLGLRAFEFTTLNIRWDQNAYGSLIWVLLGLHTAHLLTDLGDTLVLTVLMFTKHGHGKRFSDVSDNAFYWYFVVASWVPIYVLIYWIPRW